MIFLFCLMLTFDTAYTHFVNSLYHEILNAVVFDVACEFTQAASGNNSRWIQAERISVWRTYCMKWDREFHSRNIIVWQLLIPVSSSHRSPVVRMQLDSLHFFPSNLVIIMEALQHAVAFTVIVEALISSLVVTPNYLTVWLMWVIRLKEFAPKTTLSFQSYKLSSFHH